MIPSFKKNKRKSYFGLLSNLLILGGLLFVLVLLVIGNFKAKQKRTILYQKVEKVKKEMEKLNQEREILQSKIFQIQNKDYLEKVAREDLNLKKEGEKVVAFPITKETQAKKPEQKEKNFWQKFLEKFKSK